MSINGSLVRQHPVAILRVHHTHNLRPTEGRPATAPVTMRHAQMPPAFRTGPLLHPRRHGPMQQPRRPRPRSLLTPRCAVLQEGRKPPDYPFAVQLMRHSAERLLRHAELRCASRPSVCRKLLRPQTLLQRQQHPPLLLTELRHGGPLHGRRYRQLIPRLQTGPANMTHGQHKHTDHRKRHKIPRSDLLRQQATMRRHCVTSPRNLERGPQTIIRSRSVRVITVPQDNVPGERIMGYQPIISRLQPIRRQPPSHQRPIRQTGRKKRLSHPAYRPRRQHSLKTPDNLRLRQSATLRNDGKGPSMEARNGILRHCQQSPIHRIRAVAGVYHCGLTVPQKVVSVASTCSLAACAKARACSGVCVRAKIVDPEPLIIAARTPSCCKAQRFRRPK